MKETKGRRAPARPPFLLALTFGVRRVGSRGSGRASGPTGRIGESFPSTEARRPDRADEALQLRRVLLRRRSLPIGNQSLNGAFPATGSATGPSPLYHPRIARRDASRGAVEVPGGHVPHPPKAVGTGVVRPVVVVFTAQVVDSANGQVARHPVPRSGPKFLQPGSSKRFRRRGAGCGGTRRSYAAARELVGSTDSLVCEGRRARDRGSASTTGRWPPGEPNPR